MHTTFWACMEASARRLVAVLLLVFFVFLRFLFYFLRLVSSLRSILCRVFPCKSGALPKRISGDSRFGEDLRVLSAF